MTKGTHDERVQCPGCGGFKSRQAFRCAKCAKKTQQWRQVSPRWLNRSEPTHPTLGGRYE